jgi:hypothetical protein
MSGLQLRSDMPFSEWKEVGRRLARICDGSAWAMGDWIVYGQTAYGRRYIEAVKATDLDYKTLRNYAWVARRFAPSRRRLGLSFQHHAQVAALSDAEQDLWLGRCETLGWSRGELRRQLSIREEPPRDPIEHVTVRVQITAARERRWREAAAAAECGLADLMTRAVDDVVETLLLSEATGVVAAWEPAGRVGPSRPRLLASAS